MTPKTLTAVCLRMAPLAVLALGIFQGCSSAPPAPDWQMEAKGATERAVNAYLTGDARVEAAELVRARKALSSTGRANRMASAELLMCAAHTASLVFEPCSGFEPLRSDADAAQAAYADYLRGSVTAAQVALLPANQRAVAVRAATDGQPLQGMDDPLSLLVAAGVLMETGRANPAIIAQAVDTASNQGWRGPLLAWLGVQKQRATQAGQTAEAARLQRHIDRVLGTATTAP